MGNEWRWFRPTFLTMYERRTVEQFSPAPYLATFISCAFWVIYGLPRVHPNALHVLTINTVGIIFETIYIAIFFFYSSRQLRLKVAMIFLAELAIIAVAAAVVLKVVQTNERRSLIVGILCVIFGTCMYAFIMKLVNQTRSVRYMPFTLSLVSFLHSVCWTAYALHRFDLFIAISNGLGALLGLIQLILYAIYYRSTPREDSPSEAPPATP